MGKRQGSDVIDFLKDIIYKDKQVLEDGAHITVKKVFNLRERGDIDFGGCKYKECEIAEINPEERSVDDKYGWWRLEKGEYLIDDMGNCGQPEFEGEWIEFGSFDFPNWNEVVKYLM